MKDKETQELEITPLTGNEEKTPEQELLDLINSCQDQALRQLTIDAFKKIDLTKPESSSQEESNEILQDEEKKEDLEDEIEKIDEYKNIAKFWDFKEPKSSKKEQISHLKKSIKYFFDIFSTQEELAIIVKETLREESAFFKNISGHINLGRDISDIMQNFCNYLDGITKLKSLDKKQHMLSTYPPKDSNEMHCIGGSGARMALSAIALLTDPTDRLVTESHSNVLMNFNRLSKNKVRQGNQAHVISYLGKYLGLRKGDGIEISVESQMRTKTMFLIVRDYDRSFRKRLNDNVVNYRRDLVTEIEIKAKEIDLGNLALKAFEDFDDQAFAKIKEFQEFVETLIGDLNEKSIVDNAQFEDNPTTKINEDDRYFNRFLNYQLINKAIDRQLKVVTKNIQNVKETNQKQPKNQTQKWVVHSKNLFGDEAAKTLARIFNSETPDPQEVLQGVEILNLFSKQFYDPMIIQFLNILRNIALHNEENDKLSIEELTSKGLEIIESKIDFLPEEQKFKIEKIAIRHKQLIAKRDDAYINKAIESFIAPPNLLLLLAQGATTQQMVLKIASSEDVHQELNYILQFDRASQALVFGRLFPYGLPNYKIIQKVAFEYLFSRFDILEILQAIKEKTLNEDEKGVIPEDFLKAAFYNALLMPNNKAAKFLLNNFEFNKAILERSPENQNALLLSASYDNKEMMEEILDFIKDDEELKGRLFYGRQNFIGPVRAAMFGRGATIPTIIHHGVRSGNPDLIRLVMNTIAEPPRSFLGRITFAQSNKALLLSSKDYDGRTPLECAIRNADSNCITVLLEASRETPSHRVLRKTISSAARFCKLDGFQMLLEEYGSERRQLLCATSGRLLQYACSSGNLDNAMHVVSLFENAGKDPKNYLNNKRSRAALSATAGFDYCITKLPIELAVASGNGELVQFLIDKGAKFDIKTFMNPTSLTTIAIANDKPSSLKVLLRNGLKIEKDDLGFTYERYNANSNSQEMVNLLLANGCRTNKWRGLIPGLEIINNSDFTDLQRNLEEIKNIFDQNDVINKEHIILELEENITTQGAENKINRKLAALSNLIIRGEIDKNKIDPDYYGELREGLQEKFAATLPEQSRKVDTNIEEAEATTNLNEALEEKSPEPEDNLVVAIQEGETHKDDEEKQDERPGPLENAEAQPLLPNQIDRQQ